MTNREKIKSIFDEFPALEGMTSKELTEMLLVCAFSGEKKLGKAAGELLKFKEEDRILR